MYYDTTAASAAHTMTLKKKPRPSHGDDTSDRSFASRDGSYTAGEAGEAGAADEGTNVPGHRCPPGLWQWGVHCMTEEQLRAACAAGENPPHPLIAPLCATLPPEEESYMKKWGLPLAAGAFALGAFYFVSRKK
jgi:hypothetical protein